MKPLRNINVQPIVIAGYILAAVVVGLLLSRTLNRNSDAAYENAQSPEPAVIR